MTKTLVITLEVKDDKSEIEVEIDNCGFNDLELLGLRAYLESGNLKYAKINNVISETDWDSAF